MSARSGRGEHEEELVGKTQEACHREVFVEGLPANLFATVEEFVGTPLLIGSILEQREPGEWDRERAAVFEAQDERVFGEVQPRGAGDLSDESTLS